MIETFCFYPIDARMYVITEGQKALIVDPCISNEVQKLMKKKGVSDVLVLLTHEHYDHISGVNWLRENYSEVKVVCSAACAAALPKPSKNLSTFWEILFIGKDEKTQEYVRNMNIQPYSCEADRVFEGEYEMSWEGHSVFLKETPGHSKGSICILLDEKILFSGDSLVTGHPTITRLPGGSKKEYAEITIPYLRSLDMSITVYPGHGKKMSLGQYNSLIE